MQSINRSFPSIPLSPRVRHRCVINDLVIDASALTPRFRPAVTESLNASLHVHAQTLELIAIQRSTANLPFQLITPGRTFLKRGPLLQVVGSVPKEREFLLFSDCVIWIASAEKDSGDGVGKWDLLQPDRKSQDGLARPKTLVRTRSKSDADLPRFSEVKKRESGLKLRLGGQKKNMKRLSSAGTEDRWIYKGHIDLVDVEVVAASAADEGSPHRFEILSPHTSFACYTGKFLRGMLFCKRDLIHVNLQIAQKSAMSGVLQSETRSHLYSCL